MRYFSGFQRPDGGRKYVVQSYNQILLRDGRCGGEGRYLGQGVDSGIGASGALGKDLLAGDSGDGLCQRALNRAQAGLHLPAMEFRSIVREGELKVAHAEKCLARKNRGALPSSIARRLRQVMLSEVRYLLGRTARIRFDSARTSAPACLGSRPESPILICSRSPNDFQRRGVLEPARDSAGCGPRPSGDYANLPRNL